tara:strand:- start:316 stop:618 length:303 start_codon:yes stop_codon:yes gene_type:complete
MTKPKKRKKIKKIIFILILLFLNTSSISFAIDNNCKEFKKFSVEYFKCKGNIVKDKTISAGQNIIKDTKDYQNKEWSEEKKKINKAKDKINKTKKKILDQ